MTYYQIMNKKRFSHQQGSALVEGLIAILVLAVGILAMLQYQVTSMRDNTQAATRVTAVMLANEILALAESETDKDQLTCYTWSASTPSPCAAPNLKNVVNNWAARVQASLPGASTLTPTVTYSTTTYDLLVTIRWQLPDGQARQYEAKTNFAALY